MKTLVHKRWLQLHWFGRVKCRPI